MPHTPISPSPRRAQAWHTIPARLGVVLVAALALGAARGPHARAAAPCHVPSSAYPILQAAVEAPACTPINLAAGTSKEHVTIDRHATIRGDGQDRTVIEGERLVGLGPVVTIASGAVVTIHG